MRSKSHITMMYICLLFLWTLNYGQVLPADSMGNTNGELYGCSVQDSRMVAISARNIGSDSIKVYRQKIVSGDSGFMWITPVMPYMLSNPDTSKFILLSVDPWAVTGSLFTYIDSTVSVTMDTCYLYRVCRSTGAEIGRAYVKVRNPQLWYSYQAVKDSMEQMVRDYPDYASMEQIGNTVWGLPMYGIKVGKGRKCIGLIGAVHAAEAGPEVIVYALERFLSRQQGLLDSISLAAIPCGNWDQRQKIILGYPFYLYTNAGIPYGVNLNRNFPSSHWYDCCWDAGDYYSYYHGPSAGSEPETKAIMSFFNANQPSVILSYHAVGPLVGTQLFSGQTDDDASYIRAATEWANVWNAGEFYLDGFPGGTLSTWAKYALGVPGYEVEGGITMDDRFGPSALQVCQQDHYQRILSAARYLSSQADNENEPVVIMPENSNLVASPNPFNPSSRISYYLPQKAEVLLTLYNPQGKIVRKIMSGMVPAGRHTVQVEADGLSSGIYICELKAGATAKRLKLVLMR